MNERDFNAAMSTVGAALGDEQRRLVWQFAAAVAGNGGSERTRERWQRLEREKRFEEEQLSGPDLQRREREPA